MRVIAGLVLSSALVAACAKEDRPPPLPPPPPNVAGSADGQEAARQRALALGVGQCEDIAKIKTLPFRDELGQDEQFDRMVVNFEGYRSCLVGKITDDTAILDPSTGPKRHPYAVGNLAYDVITRSGLLDYQVCLPAEISDRWKLVGAQALVEWTDISGNREKLQKCVVNRLAAPNNSFNPMPLRGTG